MKKKTQKTLLIVLALLVLCGVGLGIYCLVPDSPKEAEELEVYVPEVITPPSPQSIPEAPIPEPEPEPEPEPQTITLMAVGDNLMHNALIRSGLQEDGTYNYDAFYEGISLPLSQADIKVINQETILGGSEFEYAGYPRFNSPNELGDSLIRSGFNVILHASNHAADVGAKGLFNCVEYWKQHPEVLMVGINNDEPEPQAVSDPKKDAPVEESNPQEGEANVDDANTVQSETDEENADENAVPTEAAEEDSAPSNPRNIPLLTIKDHTFAILNYTYSPNSEVIPKGVRGHLNMLCDWDKNTGAISLTKLNPDVLEDIRAAKELAEIVIVFPHWGIEYQTKPSSYQQAWAQDMADAGADLIIGTHPHVCQPAEWITAEDGSRCLCYYSLGNYVSTQRDLISMLEGMAWVTFIETEDGLEIVPESTGVFCLINHYKYNPLRFDYVYFLEDYTEEIGATHGIPLWGNDKMNVDRLLQWQEEIFGDMALKKADIFPAELLPQPEEIEADETIDNEIDAEASEESLETPSDEAAVSQAMEE